MANPRKFSDKIALHKQKEAQERAAFEAIMREVSDVQSRTALNNLEEMQHNSMVYRNNDRSRSVGVGPMRPRPMEKRHDTSPYSGVPYLSPPPPDTWRRTNSDSALHQSANEACQSATTIPHRRDQHNMTGSGSDNRNRDIHYAFIERPRSSCEIPRVPGNNIDPSSQPPGQQIPIGNTRSLPDLVHFPDQEDHSSITPFSNNHLSVPVNSRFLHKCKGGVLENNTSTSQQDLQTYSQLPHHQTATSHSPAGHYIYQQSHSPVPPQSPTSSQTQPQAQQINSLGSYRSSQQVNRPSPQSSPGLTIQGSPLSYSNNPSAPPSPTGHPGPPNQIDRLDQSGFFQDPNDLQQDFAQFTMMDTPVSTNIMGSYMGSPNHTANYTQNDTMHVGNELGSGDAGYFSTSPQMPYQPTTTTTTSNNTTHQLTPQTPNTPTIILTDFSAPDDLSTPEFVKELGTAMMGELDPDFFPSDDDLRQGLNPIDMDGLQMLTDPTMIISDPSTEAHFRRDRL